MTGSATRSDLVACRDCDALHRVAEVEPHSVARCSRCRARLYANKTHARRRVFPYTLASLILLVLANALPFMSFSRAGMVVEIYFGTGIAELFAQGFYVVAATLLVVTAAAPVARVLGLLYLMLPVTTRRALPGWRATARLVGWTSSWGMLDVFLLGVLVAIVKLVELADVGLGHGFYAFIALIVTSALAAASFHPDDVWEEA